MKKKTILDLYEMKRNGEKASWITSYDAPFAIHSEWLTLASTVQFLSQWTCALNTANPFDAERQILLLLAICHLVHISVRTRMRHGMQSAF